MTIGMNPSPAPAARTTNLREFVDDLVFRPCRNRRHKLVKGVQQAASLALGQSTNAVGIVGNRFPNDLAFRLAQSVRGIAKASRRLFINAKGHLDVRHTRAILPYRRLHMPGWAPALRRSIASGWSVLGRH